MMWQSCMFSRPAFVQKKGTKNIQMFASVPISGLKYKKLTGHPLGGLDDWEIGRRHSTVYPFVLFGFFSILPIDKVNIDSLYAS